MVEVDAGLVDALRRGEALVTSALQRLQATRTTCRAEPPCPPYHSTESWQQLDDPEALEQATSSYEAAVAAWRETLEGARQDLAERPLLEA